MSLLKTGACFTAELKLNCPTIVACVTALPTGPAAVPGDEVLGADGMFHALPAAAAPTPQALSLAGQTLTLSGGGGSVLLPDSDDQTLTLVGSNLSISGGNTVTLPASPGQVAQVLSIAGNTVSLSGGGGSITVPDSDDQALSISGNTLSLTNGGSVTLPSSSVAFATPAETVAGTSTTLAVNPADLYARENIAAQTGLSNNIASIPAPTAAQSVWGQNILGETLHYSPGLGWKVVADQYSILASPVADVALVAGIETSVIFATAPRAGAIDIFANCVFDDLTSSGSFSLALRAELHKNGVFLCFLGWHRGEYGPMSAVTGVSLSTSRFHQAAAGDVFSIAATRDANANMRVSSVSYLQLVYRS